MSQELDLGSIVVNIQLAAEQLEQTADSAVSKLNAIGAQGLATQQKINPLSTSLNQVGKSINNIKFDKLTNKLNDLNSKFSFQQNVVGKLGAELDNMASSYAELEKAAGRSGNFDLQAVFPTQTAEYDKEIKKLDELKQQIKITTRERQVAADAAVQAAQKQAQAAEQAATKQQQLNQKLADKTATNSASLSMDAAAMSIRGVSSAAGGAVGSLGYLATEIMFLKRTMTAGATAGAAFASILSFGVMAAVTLVSTGIQALEKREQERQQAFEDGVRNLKQYSEELINLKNNFSILQDQKSTTEQLTTARKDLASTFPDLIVGYTDENEAILASNDLIKQYIASQKEAARIAREGILLDAHGAEKFEEQTKKLNERNLELEKSQKIIASLDNMSNEEKAMMLTVNGKATWAMAKLKELPKLINEAEQARYESLDSAKSYYAAQIESAVRVSNANNDIIQTWDDLNNESIAVANNYKSSVIDKIVNGNLSAKEATKYIKQEVENLNTLLSDPTAMTEYYNKLTATIQSEKATAALEEINQKINSQISSLGNLQSAYSSLNNGQQLSLDQLYDLAQAYPEVSKYIAETGDLTLRNGEILAEVYNAKRETFLAEQKMRLDSLIIQEKDLEATKRYAEEKIQAYLSIAGAMGAVAFSDVSSLYADKTNADSALKAVQEQINTIKTLVNSASKISISSKSSSPSASSSYRNEALQKELELLDHKKRMDQLTYEQELAWLEKIQRTLIHNDEERRDMEYRIYALKKSHAEELQKLADEEVSALDDLGKGITEALKAQYDAQRKAEQNRITESIQAWKNWEDSTVSSIQNQIDALDELEKQQESQERAAEYARKSQELKLQLAYENDDYQRKQIEKQLNALSAEEQKRLRQEAVEAEKSALQDEIEAVKEKASSQQEILQTELNNLNSFYEERTKAASLQAEAEQIIMNNNQKEIVSLIRSYAPDYASAGETLGSQLVEAFKKKVNNVISYVEDITNQINNYTSSVVAVANSAADNFIAKTSGKQSATSSKSVTIKQTNNINQPVASPIQTARALDDVSQKLARQILGG